MAAVLRRTLLFLEVFILSPGACFPPSPPLHHFFAAVFFLWVWVLFTSAVNNVDCRCLLEIRILLRVKKKKDFVNSWKKNLFHFRL